MFGYCIYIYIIQNYFVYLFVKSIYMCVHVPCDHGMYIDIGCLSHQKVPSNSSFQLNLLVIRLLGTLCLLLRLLFVTFSRIFLVLGTLALALHVLPHVIRHVLLVVTTLRTTLRTLALALHVLAGVIGHVLLVVTALGTSLCILALALHVL